MNDRPTKRLHRSSKDKMLFGVAGGLAEHLDIDPVFIRVAFVVLGFMFWGVVVYIALAVLTPQESAPASSPGDTARKNVEQIGAEATAAANKAGEEIAKLRVDRLRASYVGGLLVVVGAIILASNLGWFGRWFWSRWWPVGIVAVGALLLLGLGRRKQP